MPSKGRKSDKDGISKKRKAAATPEPAAGVPRKKDSVKKSRLSESKGDSLATATLPRKNSLKSKKETTLTTPDSKKVELEPVNTPVDPVENKEAVEPTKPTSPKPPPPPAPTPTPSAAESKPTDEAADVKPDPLDSELKPSAPQLPNTPTEVPMRGRPPASAGKTSIATTENTIKSNSVVLPPEVVVSGKTAGKTSGKNPKKLTKKNSLKIDTSKTKPEMGDKGKSPRPDGAKMDTHPYQRGSVIEVWHGVDDSSDEEADWWSDGSEEKNYEEKPGASIRLCDVIDRVPHGDKWRYYVHYRDFNRRMDEWVSMDRIVSPPSVGNAKARAIKQEKKKEERKKQRTEVKKEEIIDVSAPRASRRRLSTQIPGIFDAGPVDMDSETPRRTRHSRKKSLDESIGGILNPNDNAEVPAEPVAPVMAAEKGIVALPTDGGTHTTTVGEHVVHTISAQELDEHEGLDDAALREHEEVTKVKNVAFLELGAYQMETWYFSPLPKELLSEQGYTEVLYVCEFTFSMFARKSELQRFQSRLPVENRHPPGNEIYRKGNLAMFEVDGFEERIYCQNLCYIAKLFLDHKTLYFDVDPFLFYVLCEVDERGFHPVGYYSKEKYSDVGYNLACILTFPCHQRKGYGRFLIAFSYELSKKEEKVGSPEKPMSDLGQQAYKPYWASTVIDFLRNQDPDSSSLSIMDISKMTSIMAEDIVFTLNQLGLLKIINGVYFIAAEEGLLNTLAKKYPVKEPRVDPACLHWTPYATDVKRDKFSIHSKKPNLEGDEDRGSGGFP